MNTGRSLQSEVKTIPKEAVPDSEGAWKRIAKRPKDRERSGKAFGDRTPLILNAIAGGGNGPGAD